jgi:hypothetical protein
LASTNKDDIGVRPLNVPNWELGMKTSISPTEIEDNAAVDILNFEWDDAGNLSTRCGLVELLADTFSTRITSLHYFENEAGVVGVLFTTGNKLYVVQTDGTGLTDITGSLTLPTDTYWQWVTFQGIAIGVNKASSGDNPIKVNGSAVASALGGSPPKGKYVQVWNSRLWIVSATDPNQLWGSKIGDPEDWTTGGGGADDALSIDIDPDDNDHLNGLFATRDAIYAKKRKRIYKVEPTTIDPTTNPQGFKLSIHSQTLGCVSGYSIFPIPPDDVVFLSESGLASLALAATVEDFRTAMYSRYISELTRFAKSTEEIPGYLFDTAEEYWISLPASISPRQVDEVYVLDYKFTYQGVDRARWTRFDGLAAFTAATSFIGPAGKTYILGAKNPDGEYQLYTYRPKVIAGPYNDNGAGYAKKLTTKAYTVELPLIRKWWKKWGVGFNLLTNSAQVSVQYYFDENITKGGDESFTLASPTGGAFWDSALWDDAEWDSAVKVPLDIVRRTQKNESGQKGQSITIEITNGQADEAIVIKNLLLLYSILSERRVSDI